MANPLGSALLALSLGAVVASSLVFVSCLRLGGTATLLALWIAAAGQVVLLAQLLSLLNALDWPGFLTGQLLVAGAAGIWVRRRRGLANLGCAVREVRAGLRRVGAVAGDWRRPAQPILAGVVLLTGLINTTLALWVPPNSVDSLAYHLARVGYYLQFRSMGVYPTDDPRQVVFPANAEVLILWTMAFLRADALANTVQLAAWIVTTVAVYGLGRQVGFERRAALFGAGAFALLPQAILQSTSTLNDLMVPSFLTTSLYFLLWAVQSGRPIVGLTLAGAAGGLAVGTKLTALLALPGLITAAIVLFGLRRRRPVLPGFILGGVAAVLLGGFCYLQTWLVFESLFWPARGPLGQEAPWVYLAANLPRTLFAFAFADLSGPLADPLAQPLTVPLTRALAAVGEPLFAVLAIPTLTQGESGPPARQFSFVRPPRVNELYSGVGLVGGLILILALTALCWPGRSPPGRRLLGWVALSFLILMSALLPWNAVASGRFLLTACALGAPLLGVLVQGDGAWRQRLALILVIWSEVTGLYVARANEDKPIPEFAREDRLGLMSFRFPMNEAFFREVDDELGPDGAVGVYGALNDVGQKDQWEYLLFGPRLSRTLLPLVAADYPRRRRLRAPPPWTNESLLATYRPTYVVLRSPRPGAEELPDLLPGRCFDIPLAHARPAVEWEVWRCEDRDPRNVVQHADFSAWSLGPGSFRLSPEMDSVETADGWLAHASGGGSLEVSRLTPETVISPTPSGGESFRIRLDSRAGGRGGIVQGLPADRLRGSRLVVDARVWSDRVGAALLWVDDGVKVVRVANRTTWPETLRADHLVDAGAIDLSIGLDASHAAQDAVVLVRVILAIPR
ncbi:MAG: glycosyltransferase family 39 protein [Chloroflexi bacterium]|nr:glycosyltransferase family 39 protein [Chloroflexota bacterium]